MKKNLSLFILILISKYSFCQSFVQIIEKTEANKNLFERNSPTSLFSILEYNTVEIHPMDSASEELMRPFFDLNTDYYSYGPDSFYPLKSKNGLDSMGFDPLTKSYFPVYPERDLLVSIVDSLTHLIIQFDSSVQSKKDFSILSIERIYFARRINNSEKLVCTGWFSFKELIEIQKLNCVTINEVINKEILSKTDEFKTSVYNTVLEWERQTRKAKNLSDEIDQYGLRDEIYIKEKEAFSFYLNNINPDFWTVNWLIDRNKKNRTNQYNRYQIPFDWDKEIEKENYGENQILTFIDTDYQLVNADGEDSMLRSEDGTWVALYPVKRIIVWADYPTNKLHFRYSIQLDEKLGLTYEYKLEEIYYIGEIEGKEKCIYNFNRKDFSEREYFKDLIFPEFERTFFESLNSSKNSTPDFIADLMNSIKSTKEFYNLIKSREKLRFSELIDLPE